MVRTQGKTYKHNAESTRAALNTIKRFLLKEIPRDDCVAKAVCRIQVIDAIQVILDSTNEKVLQPEECYVLKANYHVKMRREIAASPEGSSEEGIHII
jgi:hypothetical protein